MSISDNNRPIPRIAAIHDLSCFGRCALTVILPVLSAMGNQAVPLPTALLSTHTGGYEVNDIHFVDLTSSMLKTEEHFAKLGIGFDAIYTGFLGSLQQTKTVSGFIDNFGGKSVLVMVDPVMGDDGALYSTYTHELMLGMRDLCNKADIITPNLTEACFLTGTEYRDTSELNRDAACIYASKLCKKLCVFGAKKIVITGISHSHDCLATFGRDEEANSEFLYSTRRIAVNYPGTGDLFASVLLGKLLEGCEFEAAVKAAADFVILVIEYSAKFATPVRDGVAFEKFLGVLTPHNVEG